MLKSKFKKFSYNSLKKSHNKICLKYINENDLNELINSFGNSLELDTHEMKSYTNVETTGVSISDYVHLHALVRKNKPLEILELGTGNSSMIIADALKKNFDEFGIKGTLTSMEHEQKWYELQKKNFPSHLNEYFKLHLEKQIEKRYYFLIGNCYESIPDKNYDLIFIDGPPQEIVTYKNQPMGITLDLFFVLERTSNPVTVIIDNRTNTCLAYSLLFEPNKVEFYKPANLGLMNSITKEDIKINEDDYNSLVQNLKHHLNFQYSIPYYLK